MKIKAVREMFLDLIKNRFQLLSYLWRLKEADRRFRFFFDPYLCRQALAILPARLTLTTLTLFQLGQFHEQSKNNSKNNPNIIIQFTEPRVVHENQESPWYIFRFQQGQCTTLELPLNKLPLILKVSQTKF